MCYLIYFLKGPVFYIYSYRGVSLQTYTVIKLLYILYSERELDHEFHYIHLHMHGFCMDYIYRLFCNLHLVKELYFSMPMMCSTSTAVYVTVATLAIYSISCN